MTSSPWILCTSGSAIAKAGTHANTVIIASGSLLATFSNDVEAEICSLARSDVVTNYSSLTANGKQVLGHLASCMIAQHIVSYDMSGYIPFGEAIAINNVLENQITREIKVLTEDKNKTFLGIVT